MGIYKLQFKYRGETKGLAIVKAVTPTIAKAHINNMFPIYITKGDWIVTRISSTVATSSKLIGIYMDSIFNEAQKQ